jgi:hypothetical protein
MAYRHRPIRPVHENLPADMNTCEASFGAFAHAHLSTRKINAMVDQYLSIVKINT